ncbi:endonuclease/exonuclease/phosphatase family protein [Stigmatella aurantiaca]|uniref:Endonuclease/exonuclease/phosphatase domain protein n=1 Tax=Stigmatella aurantiaca (strain DW4/3-1) TaxID=378806 RepID=Q09BG4_STIAD|nr:putative Ig domain-containing protein [Stigmatella aurantiaca]ADO69030.1 Endonuclease/exonuclease/phosphatase domain protein [Stigmatella aurantiaca DW4/3-1]EAU69026.1 putative hemagglutinin-related protein [Stigmatella aurantiaca DW4/3-1]
MLFARAAATLLTVLVLSACAGREESGDGPLLPTIQLPSTTVGLAYEVRLTATGGTGTLRYSVEEVPEGFSFYADTGLLKGPAAAPGTFTLYVGVKDDTGEGDARTYSLRVYPAPRVTRTDLPAATLHAAYAFSLSATGGQPPLKWALVEGTLPLGLRLSESGDITGVTLDTIPGLFRVRVQDANGAQATEQLSLAVSEPPPDSGTPDSGTPDSGTPDSGTPDSGTPDSGTPDSGTPDSGTPDAGTPFPLSVGNWNLEWFGSTTNGPSDDSLQLSNVRAVMADAGIDFWALQEVVNAGTLAQLKQAMPGYDGFAANDSRVIYGASYYTASEQKPAVLFKSGTVQVLTAEIILTHFNYEFAGRPPLQLRLRVTRGNTSLEMFAIILHMKAQTGGIDDYNQRKAAGAALKQYLDSQLSNVRVIVLGDWNDDVDISIYRDSGSYLPSPYQNFVEAPASYQFLTMPLSVSGVGSTVGYSTFIDHQLISNELFGDYVGNSTQVLYPAIPNYANTTSDHYPIQSRFDFGDPAF